MSVDVELALGPDCNGGLLEDVIETSRVRLDIAVYELGPGWARLVAAAARREVATRVLVDAHGGPNATSAILLAGSRVELRVAGGHGTELHCKLILGGGPGGRLAIGTGNLIDRDAPRGAGGRVGGVPAAGTREWWSAVAGCPDLVAAAGRFIATRWAVSRPPVGRPIAGRAAVAPPVNAPTPAVGRLRLRCDEARLQLACGAAACRGLLLASIVPRARRIDVVAPYVHARAPAVATLLDRLTAATRRGAAVRLLLGRAGDVDPATIAALVARGIEARVMDPARTTTGHAKGMIVDDRVVLGSANLSAAGLGRNDEAMLAIDDADAAAYFGAAFGRDWTASQPPLDR